MVTQAESLWQRKTFHGRLASSVGCAWRFFLLQGSECPCSGSDFVPMEGKLQEGWLAVSFSGADSAPKKTVLFEKLFFSPWTTFVGLLVFVKWGLVLRIIKQLSGIVHASHLVKSRLCSRPVRAACWALTSSWLVLALCAHRLHFRS